MPAPDRTHSLVVVIGASRFPRAPELSGGRPFSRSAEAFITYLNADDGFGLHQSNLLDLFDDSRSATQQLEEISQFLQEKQHNEQRTLENLLIYYIGHGLFTPNDRKYCLALRSTNGNNIGLSAMRGRDLAEVVSSGAAHLRRFLIFDCCFAGSMLGEFLSAPGEAATVQMIEEFPARGTSILCASSSQDVALAPQTMEFTMFSDALLKVLREGNATFDKQLSMRELKSTLQSHLQTDYPAKWVRPELHSPDMRLGDISSVPLFPNRAFRQVNVDRGRTDHEVVGAPQTGVTGNLPESVVVVNAKASPSREGNSQSIEFEMIAARQSDAKQETLRKESSLLQQETARLDLLPQPKVEESKGKSEETISDGVEIVEPSKDQCALLPTGTKSRSAELKPSGDSIAKPAMHDSGQLLDKLRGFSHDVVLRQSRPVIVAVSLVFLAFVAASAYLSLVRINSNQTPIKHPQANYNSPTNIERAPKEGALSTPTSDTQAPTPSTIHKPEASSQTGLEEPQMGVWPDPTHSLMWTARDSFSTLTWSEAQRYCRTARFAGYSDWRVPSGDQLETLFDPKARVPGIGAKKKVLMYVKGNLQLSGDQLSSDTQQDKQETNAFSFDWNYAGDPGNHLVGYSTWKGAKHRALCVRNFSP